MDEIWQTKINFEETEKRFLKRLNNEHISQYNQDTLKKILKNQLSPQEKIKYCSNNIDTSKDFEITKLTYDNLYEDLVKKFLI